MVAVNTHVVACLAVSDPLKPEARGVVSALAQRGISCWLVTGDNWRTARSISSALAITNVIADCMPEGKVDKIRVGGDPPSAQHTSLLPSPPPPGFVCVFVRILLKPPLCPEPPKAPSGTWLRRTRLLSRCDASSSVHFQIATLQLTYSVRG